MCARISAQDLRNHLETNVYYREAKILIDGSALPMMRGCGVVRARALSALKRGEAAACFAKAAELKPRWQRPVAIGYGQRMDCRARDRARLVLCIAWPSRCCPLIRKHILAAASLVMSYRTGGKR